MENQNFFIDLYGYENYNGQELTDEFINNGDYLDCDAEIKDGKYWLANYIKDLEEQWTLTTELFVKLRVLKWTPIFEHLAKGGKVRLEMI